MAEQDDEKPRAGLGYPLAQLLEAAAGAGRAAASRLQDWQAVVSGMLRGLLAIGSRTPVGGMPAWATLEVVRGGFATGNLAAGGPLRPHELEQLAGLGFDAGPGARSALNLHHVDPVGRAGLHAMLVAGTFRVEVPEEAALLTVDWLQRRGEPARAGLVLEAILPFFDRLRFYPVPHSTPRRAGLGVHVQPVADSVASLRKKRPSSAMRAMHEAVHVWAPLTDRAVALWLETVEGDAPRLGAGSDAPPGRLVEGGWPCRSYPVGWTARARELLEDHRRARAEHTSCKKPDDPRENYARLRGYLGTAVQQPERLAPADVTTIRRILATHAHKHGAPGSTRAIEKRGAQRRDVAAAPHQVLAHLVAERLERLPPDEGAPDLETSLAPVSTVEADRLGIAAGQAMPAEVVRKALRCIDAPVEVLLDAGVLGSAEAMAGVQPLVTARTRAEAIGDPELRRLYEAVYTAFRRRRSLLLLDLQSQVKLHELPWVAAIEPWVASDDLGREAARTALTTTAVLALRSFPQTIVPNKLVKELRALASAAGLKLALVDELAADIFMGAFAVNYLQAAKTAAGLLDGTLYVRYYGIPTEAVLALQGAVASPGGTATSPAFAALCASLAGPALTGAKGSGVARNGAIIEQAQILTTHNLATLFSELDLASRLPLPELARRCFRWVCRRQRALPTDWRAQLRVTKNTAYAWRQMLFYLSLVSPDELEGFMGWAHELMGRQREPFRSRFAPVFAGLVAAVAGESFGPDGIHRASGGRRFLGWSVGRHPLLPERAEARKR